MPCPGRQGSAHFSAIMNPTTLYSKSMRRFSHSSDEPSSLLPQGLFICRPLHQEPSPHTSHSAQPSSHVMSIPARQMRPRSVILSYITMFFSFIAPITASNHIPLASLCLTSFFPCPGSSLFYPLLYPYHLAQGLMRSKCLILIQWGSE